jgi:glutamine synthetase
LSNIGIATKYGHSEVGRIAEKNGEFIEQQEIELAAQTLSTMAESVPIAKWVIRNVCARHGFSVSFAPKITAEHAGTGMHIHICAFRNDKNLIAGADGTLGTEAKRMIGGILKFAPSLSAFANPTPISYLRFIARKESPMHICWSERNRLALIRIPLWHNLRKTGRGADECGQTFEYRAPDAFANPYTLLAGITVAANYGLNNPKEALKTAKDLHVDNHAEKKPLRPLPLSCDESADNLTKDRQLYESNGVFSAKLIAKTIESLKSYNDKKLWQKLTNKPEETEKVLKQHRHHG